jgi:hypothetical protein
MGRRRPGGRVHAVTENHCKFKEIPMKHMIAVFSFVLALTLAGTAGAATASNVQEHLSKKQLVSLVVSAKTPAEHQRIAEYYRAASENYLAQAGEHARMAVDFEKNPATNNDKVARTTVDHCQYLAKSLQARATVAAALAQQHEQMAKEAGRR